VSFPIKNGGSFHSYVSLPEGKLISPSKILKKKRYQDAQAGKLAFHDIP